MARRLSGTSERAVRSTGSSTLFAEVAPTVWVLTMIWHGAGPPPCAAPTGAVAPQAGVFGSMGSLPSAVVVVCGLSSGARQLNGCSPNTVSLEAEPCQSKKAFGGALVASTL